MIVIVLAALVIAAAFAFAAWRLTEDPPGRHARRAAAGPRHELHRELEDTGDLEVIR